MLKKFLTLFFGILLITACANTNANDNDNNDDNNDAPSSSRSNSSNASEGDADSDESDEPLPPITATLKIVRTGVQTAGQATVNWSLSGEVEIVILRDKQSSSPPASPRLAKVILLQGGDEEEEEDEEVLQASFSASGQGSGSWSFAGGNCTGGGEFGLQYEITGQYNPETGAIDMNLVENWTGGSSSAVCAGQSGSGPIPPGVIPLNPIKMDQCENGDAQVENKWVQHPEAGGGITWFDQFTLEALEISGPDGADVASDLSANLFGDGNSDGGETDQADADANQPDTTDPNEAQADADANQPDTTDPNEAQADADANQPDTTDPNEAQADADANQEDTSDPNEAQADADANQEDTSDPNEADADASKNPPLNSTCPDG